MSKRLVTWLTAAGLLLTAVVVGWYSYNGGTYVVRIKAAEAQARVDAMLARRAESGPRSINVSNVVVVFADDQVYIDAHVTGTKLGRKVQTDIHAVGKPRYSGGSFYFTPTAPVEFKNAKVEKVESGKKPFFEKTRELLKKKVDVFIIEHGYEEVVTSFKSEFEEWAKDIVQQFIATELPKYPLYTFKNDFKSIAVKAVLEKVETVGDELQATLSLTQFAYSIFLAVMFVLIAFGMIGFLVACPGWGLLLAVV